MGQIGRMGPMRQGLYRCCDWRFAHSRAPILTVASEDLTRDGSVVGFGRWCWKGVGKREKRDMKIMNNEPKKAMRRQWSDGVSESWGEMDAGGKGGMES